MPIFSQLFSFLFHFIYFLIKSFTHYLAAQFLLMYWFLKHQSCLLLQWFLTPLRINWKLSPGASSKALHASALFTPPAPWLAMSVNSSPVSPPSYSTLQTSHCFIYSQLHTLQPHRILFSFMNVPCSLLLQELNMCCFCCRKHFLISTPLTAWLLLILQVWEWMSVSPESPWLRFGSPCYSPHSTYQVTSPSNGNAHYPPISSSRIVTNLRAKDSIIVHPNVESPLPSPFKVLVLSAHMLNIYLCNKFMYINRKKENNRKRNYVYIEHFSYDVLRTYYLLGTVPSTFAIYSFHDVTGVFFWEDLRRY